MGLFLFQRMVTLIGLYLLEIQFLAGLQLRLEDRVDAHAVNPPMVLEPGKVNVVRALLRIVAITADATGHANLLLLWRGAVRVIITP